MDMNKGKILLNKRGVSPVIAALILIGVALAIGILFYTVAMGIFSRTMPKGGTLVIESIEAVAPATGGKLSITIRIRNTGQNPLTITGKTILNARTGTAITMAEWAPSRNISLQPGEGASISGRSRGNITPGTSIIVKLTYNTGSMTGLVAQAQTQVLSA